MATRTYYPTVSSPDGAVLLHVQGGHLVTLNETAAYVWNELQQGRSEEEIVSRLVDETGTPPDIVKTDLHHLLSNLKELGFLSYEGPIGQ